MKSGAYMNDKCARGANKAFATPWEVGFDLARPLLQVLGKLVLMTGAIVAMAAVAWADSHQGGYTNHAGNVIAGWPVALTKTHVTLGECGAPLGETYPLSIFPQSERRRIAADFGEPILPRKVANAEAGVRREVRRALKRGEKGLIGKDEAEQNANDLRGAFKMYLDASARDGVITETEKRAVMRRNGL